MVGSALIYPWEPIRGTEVIWDALQAYGLVWKARRPHLHKLYPGKIEKLIEGSRMKLLDWKFFPSLSSAFVTVLGREPERGISRWREITGMDKI